MPHQETTSRHQKAVLWAANGTDDNGDVEVDAAVEIDVRWEEKRTETLDPAGNTIAADATVVVNQDIAVGSIMWPGELEDVADPPVDLWQVIDFNKIPDVKGRAQRRTVMLMRHSNELPELA